MKRLVVLTLPVTLLLPLAACTRVSTTGGEQPASLAPLTFGSPGYDAATGLAEHSTGVYAVGFTTGDLDGPQAGEVDAFVRKVDKSGAVLWAQQFGTDSVDFAGGVASDANDNAYVVGGTYGSLGGPYGGQDDTFLRKYSPGGRILWTRQFAAGFFDDGFQSQVAVSGNHVYVVGTVDPYTADSNAFIKKFSANGTEQWTEEFGTSGGDHALDVAVDREGNAYAVGYTFGPLAAPVGGATDMFIRKYTPRGAVTWTRQLDYRGTDIATSVAVDGKEVYLAGYDTPGDDNANRDARVVKFSTSGTKRWDKAFDLGGNDYLYDVSAAGGGVVFAGESGSDGFVVKLNADGSEVWQQRQSTFEDDSTAAVLARKRNEVYAAGVTSGVLGSANRGDADAFLRRIRGSDGSTVWTEQ